MSMRAALARASTDPILFLEPLMLYVIILHGGPSPGNPSVESNVSV